MSCNHSDRRLVVFDITLSARIFHKSTDKHYCKYDFELLELISKKSRKIPDYAQKWYKALGRCRARLGNCAAMHDRSMIASAAILPFKPI